MISSFVCRKACIGTILFILKILLCLLYLKDITCAHESRNKPAFIRYPNFGLWKCNKWFKKFKVLAILYNQGHGTFISKFS